MKSLNQFLKNRCARICCGVLTITVSLVAVSLLVRADTTTPATGKSACVEPKQADYDKCIAACGDANAALETYNTCQTGCDSVTDLLDKSNCSNTCIGNWQKAGSDRSDCFKACLDDSSKRSAAYNACLNGTDQQIDNTNNTNTTTEKTNTEVKLIKKLDCSGVIKKENLRTFKASQFKGDPITAQTDFLTTLRKLNQLALKYKIQIYITHSFRSPDQTLEGAIVKPAGRSNHLVGHAIDFNILYDNGKECNSVCLGNLSTAPKAVQDFINAVRKDKGLKWGGDFKGKDFDPVHIDDRLNIKNPKKYDTLLKNINCPKSK